MILSKMRISILQKWIRLQEISLNTQSAIIIKHSTQILTHLQTNLKTIMDMHIHSLNSDGTYTLKEIIDKAKSNSVNVLSVTDHNCLDAHLSSDVFVPEGLILIPGVEIDAVYKGRNYHVLGFGVDVHDVKFQCFVKGVFNTLEAFNEGLIVKMEKQYPEISVQDYRLFEYDRSLGGWKLLHYLKEKNYSTSILGSFKAYVEFNHSYDEISFPSIQEVCEAIHEAGGIAVLAHPGKVIKNVSADEFLATLDEIAQKFKIEWIECYYPSHSEEITAICLELCNKYDLIWTCGSDCHGSFEKTEIGELNIPVNEELLIRIGNKE